MTELEENALKSNVKKHDNEFKKLISYAESTNLNLIKLQKEFIDYKRKTATEINELKKIINNLRNIVGS